jgi:predicted Zn-dependent protease
MIAPAEAGGMIAAGDLVGSAIGNAVINSAGLSRYYPVTEVECSMTVRDAKGTGSGWAGVSHYDYAKISPDAIAARAVEKCRRSVNPVAVEPGRYTAVLEPQALSDLFTPLIEREMDRMRAEHRQGPFQFGAGQSKIGQRVLDPRLTVYADPMDPDAGFLPFDPSTGVPYRPVTWIDHGILRELAYEKDYALHALQTDQALLNSKSYVLTPAPGVPTTTVDEMIAGTERGVLVTRFSNVRLVDEPSMLSTGYTRDGLWLIEKGTISKAIKNFRFVESPLIALNNLQMVGTPVRVYRPGFATKVPAVQVRDFSFVGLADAV